MSVTFGQGLVVVSLRWTAFKGTIASKGLPIQFVDEESHYAIFAMDGVIVYSTDVWKQGFQPSPDYSQAQNDADKADFESAYQSAANKPVVPTDGYYPVQVPFPRTGAEATFVTHNFCDPTTWYMQSVRSSDESLSDSGGGLTWAGSHPSWIDLIHGKVLDEDTVCGRSEHGYSVIVKVDGVEKAQRAPFKDSGGDYEVNYSTGEVTFYSSQAGKSVTASYSYAAGSEWRLVPFDGYQIDIEGAEAQFSDNISFNDTLRFELWGYDPNDPPNKIQYGVHQYKRMVNIVDEAIGSFPLVPALGGVRGNAYPLYGFPFRYGTVRQLKSSQGLELRMKLQNDTAFGGEHTTGTFYCTVKVEES